MSELDCDCCGSTAEQHDDRVATADRWLEARPVTDAQLPADVTEAMERFLGESVETLDDVVAAMREATGGGPLAEEDLCYSDGETPHSATVGEETHYFECFFDGVALAFLADEPVEIKTETPAGEPIELTASPEGEVDSTPSDAVLSFGISRDVAPAPEAEAGGEHTDRTVDEAAIAAICPAVRAFSTRRSYETWAAAAGYATVGLPLEAGVPVAAALAGES